MRPVAKRRCSDASHNSGFTLAEMSIAGAVMLLVACGALAVYVMGYTAWRETIVLANLQRSSSVAIASIERGIREEGGFREASSFSVPSAGEVRFTSAIDSLERRFYLNTTNGQLIYRAPSGAEEVIAKNVSGLTFTRVNARRLRIKLSMQEKVINKTVNITVETEITRRN